MSELAEGARLEIVCAVKSGTEGSNPSLSAILKSIMPERKLGFFVKIKPPAHRAYAPVGKTKILTTPVRSARPTGQAGILSVFRGLKFESDADIGEKNSFPAGIK
jgi:hypothetical protein